MQRCQWYKIRLRNSEHFREYIPFYFIWILYLIIVKHQSTPFNFEWLMTLLLLSSVSRIQPCATPQTAAHQAPPPWDSPGKNTGAGCYLLLQCMKVKCEGEVARPCPTPSDPMDCSPPGSCIHGIFQARVLEWGAIAFSKWHCITVKVQVLNLINEHFWNYILEVIASYLSTFLFIFKDEVTQLKIFSMKQFECWLYLVKIIIKWIFVCFPLKNFDGTMISQS